MTRHLRISRGSIGIASALAVLVGAGCSASNPDPASRPDASSGAGGTAEIPPSGDVTSVGSGVMPKPIEVWMNHYGDGDDQTASALAVDHSGSIALAGTARGTIDFGNIPWTGSAADTDVVVAKLSREGQSLWSRRYGDSCDQRGGPVALFPAGEVLIAGDFCGKMDFGSSTVETKGSEVDLFVAAIDTLGEDLYARSFGGQGAQIARGAAVDQKGNAVIVGSFDQAFDDGTGAAPSAGMDDAFVLKLDPRGNVLWSRRFGGPQADIARAVAVDITGNIFIAGSFGGTVDFGGGPLTAPPMFTSAFLVALDPDGKHLFSRRYGDEGNAAATAVAVGVNNIIGLTGFFDGTIDLGDGPLPSAGGKDVFLITLNTAGAPFWGRAFGAGESETGTGVAVADNGYVMLTCAAAEEIKFDPGYPLSLPSSPVVSMIYSIPFDLYGNVKGGRVIWSATPLQSVGVGVDGALGTVLAGSFHGSVEREGEMVQSAGAWDVFVLRDR